jgi:hypothetical protein
VLKVRLLVRVALGLILLVVGAVILYGLSAGYYSLFGLRLRTPWNFIGSFILLIALLVGVWKIIVAPKSRRTQGRE